MSNSPCMVSSEDHTLAVREAIWSAKTSDPDLSFGAARQLRNGSAARHIRTLIATASKRHSRPFAEI